MKLMLNSCNPKEIEQALKWGILQGITMNPTMLGRSGKDFLPLFREIQSMTDLPIFAQVVSTDPDAILKEGLALSSLGENIIVKVHTNESGIKAMKKLKDEKVVVCATSIHSVIEALIAAAVGVDYSAVFVGLLAEVDEQSSNQLLQNIQSVYNQSDYSTKILAAVRSVNQLVQSAAIGVDAVTCAFSLWKFFLNNQHTRARWESFRDDWNKAYADRNWLNP